MISNFIIEKKKIRQIPFLKLLVRIPSTKKEREKERISFSFLYKMNRNAHRIWVLKDNLFKGKEMKKEKNKNKRKSRGEDADF